MLCASSGAVSMSTAPVAETTATLPIHFSPTAKFATSEFGG